MARTYTINQDTIYRDGEAVAKVDDEGIRFLEGCKKYSGPVHKFYSDWMALGDSMTVEVQRGMEVSDKMHFNGDLKKRYPDYPGEIDPMAYDKTPEFVIWLHRCYPAEAFVRYKGRKTIMDIL